ncbi:putative inorganic carbon transporter subunit DabA [Leptospira sp. GIMC2001]|uniref:putative inorganic carbon transporter subunit DabA n=1 Tax=Leptospira sp. GIMC2001 TaxID=1513297 RepID=UPI00234B9B78|nr:putative inorganic carbon transporter subunit DabA [Leptospira sp. GIMC2001]WCL50612.1 Na-translocating system protein MpsB [Leptospira sp. GIMC2001]
MVVVLNFLPILLVFLSQVMDWSGAQFNSASWIDYLKYSNIDRLSIVMVSYITILCFFILKYAVKNFEREKNGKVWLFWFIFTIYNVHFLVLTSNIIGIFISLILISYGLHKLLLCFPDRQQSQKVAWKKFVISRFGDLFFIAGFYLFYESFQTFDILQAKSILVSLDLEKQKDLVYLPSIFIAIGCLIKSAQFPFHVWLPESIDAPTPVSALMHAGIINAGGFILVRLSFLFQYAEVTNLLIVIVGILSIGLGGIAMLAQIDVKRKLAYSTLGQMGFMMVEFGLGLYGMVILHLMGHGFYKAYGFLSSGSRDLVQAPSVSLGKLHAIYTALLWLIPIVIYYYFQNLELALISILIYAIIGMVPKGNPLLGLEFGFALTCLVFLANIVGHSIVDSHFHILEDPLGFMIHAKASSLKDWIALISLSMLAGFTLSIPHMNGNKYFNKIYCYAQRGFLGTYYTDKLYAIIGKIWDRKAFSSEALNSSFLKNIYSIDGKVSNKLGKPDILKLAESIPPFFELDSYIAVNPFHGYSSYPFIDSMKRWESIVERKLVKSNEDSNDKMGNRSANDIVSNEFGNVLGVFLGSYLDNSIAYWKFPWKGQNLWSSFLEWSQVDPIGNKIFTDDQLKLEKFYELSGLDHLHSLVERNTEISVDRIEFLLYSMFGWSGIFRKQSWLESIDEKSDLISFIAILVYTDLYLQRTKANSISSNRNIDLVAHESNLEDRYKSLVQIESEYRNSIIKEIAQTNKKIHHSNHDSTKLDKKSTISSVQIDKVRARFVFCIDVRSELIRRNLEKQSNEIATDGFAGFFGMPIGWKHWTGEVITHSPALIKPSYVFESKLNKTNLTNSISLIKSWIQKVKRTFPLGFQYVESAGFFSAFGMISKTFKKFLSNKSYRIIPQVDINNSINQLSEEERGNLAFGFLKGIGWIGNFPEYNFIVGHGSTTTNNPHEAGLSCGACSGQTGEISSRFLAALLNDKSTRIAIKSKGINIPDSCQFIAALHETVTDRITLLNANIQDNDFNLKLKEWLETATLETQKEKFLKYGLKLNESFARAKDWAETFPEQGLAGCGSIIVGNRSIFRTANLHGRSFLNSYDWKNDQDGKILESTLAAPVLVASWINFQYYASTACPDIFGAGNKILHSVVGNFGVFEGNSWNLKAGLPLQSVYDGDKFIHDPIRLQVFIEAPLDMIDKALKNQPGIAELASNEWIKIIGMNSNAEFHAKTSKGWEEIKLAT